MTRKLSRQGSKPWGATASCTGAGRSPAIASMTARSKDATSASACANASSRMTNSPKWARAPPASSSTSPTRRKTPGPLASQPGTSKDGAIGMAPVMSIRPWVGRDVRGMVLERHHHDVMNFEIVGKRNNGAAGGLERDRLVVQHPVADILDAGFREVIERVERLRQPGAEPSARSPPPELLDDIH